MSDLSKRLQMNRLPPMPPPGIGAGGKRPLMKRTKDYSPVTWDNYFDSMHDIHVKGDTFRVYRSGEEGPVCLFLHGGGYSALSWAVLSKILISQVKCRCACIDLRGHGDTQARDETDLSAETLATDVGHVIGSLYRGDPPPIILVGHSMGGAIAAHVSSRNLIPSQIGLVVIDVVEGTALDSLSSMQSFLRGRPKLFNSVDRAIEWCIRTGQTRNLESARVSMVGQLKCIGTEETATTEIENAMQSEPGSDTIAEEEEEEAQGASSASNNTQQFAQPCKPVSQSNQYTWRIDLSQTEPYWRGWFEGLSNIFLSCPVPKLLLLAGIDRLDKDLTVGQMQGKFQMQVLPECGHVVHEDVPDKVADVLATFMVRHKVAEPISDFERTFPAC